MKRLFSVLVVLLTLLSAVFASDIKTLADLDGKNIGVQTAVLYEELIMDKVPHATFQYYTMPNDMILALTSGKVDAYLIEAVSFGVQHKNHPELAVLDEPAGYTTSAPSAFKHKLVFVKAGTANKGKVFYLNGDFEQIGTDELNFTESNFSVLFGSHLENL